MKVDVDIFRRNTCIKCKNYFDGNIDINKCIAAKGIIHVCAKMKMLNNKEFENYTGIREEY